MEGVSPFKVKKSKLPPIQRKSELLADAKKRREERIKRDAEEANEAGKHFRLKFSKGTIVENGALSLEEVYDFFHGTD